MHDFVILLLLLPTEILVEVARWLSTRARGRLQCTCRGMYAALRAVPSLAPTSITLTDRQSAAFVDSFAASPVRCAALRKVVAREMFNYRDQHDKVFRQLIKLRARVRSLLESCPNVATICVSEQLAAFYFDSLFNRDLGRVEGIRSIILESVQYLTVFQLQTYAWLHRFPNLTSLCLRGCSVTSRQLLDLRRLTSLKTLALERCNAGGMCLLGLTSVLQRNPSLRFLSLLGCLWVSTEVLQAVKQHALRLVELHVTVFDIVRSKSGGGGLIADADLDSLMDQHPALQSISATDCRWWTQDQLGALLWDGLDSKQLYRKQTIYTKGKKHHHVGSRRTARRQQYG